MNSPVDEELPPAVRSAWRGASPAFQAGHRAAGVDLIVATIDGLLSRFVDCVLHDAGFQQLEASWRGLAYVVAHVPFHEHIEISIWSASKEDLERDFADAAEVSRSRTFFHAYSAQIGNFGGKPYAAILGDMAFGSTPRDVRLLRQIAAVATMAHAPFFAAASPQLLQLGVPSDLPRVEDVGVLFEGPSALDWKALRDSEDSRACGLLVGRPLLRPPHTRAANFTYAERTASSDAYLWGHPAYVFAVRLATSFARYRTLSAIAGEADACPAPATVGSDALGPGHSRAPLDVTVTPRLERALREAGLMALVHQSDVPSVFLASANSLQKPKTFGSGDGGREATLTHLLGTKFPYFLFACRIAHYLKLIEREEMGQTRSRETIEVRLNSWLDQFVLNMDSAAPEMRAQYPLRRAHVRVTEIAESPDWYKAEISLRPHLRYLNAALNLSVTDRVRRA